MIPKRKPINMEEQAAIGDRMFGGKDNKPEQPLPLPETSHTQTAIATPSEQLLPIAKLIPFAQHPFRLYEGERLDDMVESIRNNGVLVPIIVRTVPNERYEILSGHNRVNAARLAELTAVPCIVKENLPDEDAWAYVTETNVMQRSFGDMLPSEKAAVLHQQHSKMFSQGKRNDIIAELKSLANPHETGDDGTCSPMANKLKTLSIIGENYGLKKDSIARLLRIYELIKPLRQRVDGNEIPLRSGVQLSYLTPPEQELLEELIAEHRFNISIQMAEQLRSASEKGSLDRERVWAILTGKGGGEKKKPSALSVKLKPKLITKYFAPNTKQKEIEETIDKALQEYFLNHKPSEDNA